MIAATKDGAPDGAREKTTFEVRNPATEELIRELPIFDREAVQAEMARVRAASRRWAEVPLRERCAQIARVGEVITRRMDEIARTVSSENGKVLFEALLHEVGPTLLVMNYFSANAPRILADEKIELAVARHRRSYLTYRPKGVVGVITPWNFPFFMPGSDVAMSLIAGNGVLLKPSEMTPLSALILKECYDEGGVDPELFRVVTGTGSTGAAMIEAGPDHVVFTGSVPTGRRVGVSCAERMIGYTLELGGKAPAIVLEDAELERTTNAILWGGFANAGQICASVERVYAAAPIYDRLVDALTERAKGLRVGPPDSDGSDIGAMTWARQRDVVEGLVRDARAKGARITTGGERTGERGVFYRPTVIADCTHDMDVMRAETFGPVVPLMRVSGEDEAIRLANESSLGLGAYVFTRDVERGRRLAERLEVGSVMVNDVLGHAGLPEMPWGGIKQSGLGVVRSERGLKELCNARHVNCERIPALGRDPYWFPYSRKQTGQLRAALETIFGASIASKLLRAIIR